MRLPIAEKLKGNLYEIYSIILVFETTMFFCLFGVLDPVLIKLMLNYIWRTIPNSGDNTKFQLCSIKLLRLENIF
jgi:hypothetical protein